MHLNRKYRIIVNLKYKILGEKEKKDGFRIKYLKGDFKKTKREYQMIRSFPN